MSELRFGAADARAQFDRLLGELRPRLHRFCARMTGSVVDGEDIVQEAMLKVLESFSGTEAIDNLEAWIFRIAHNTALDFLRRRARQQSLQSDESMDMIVDPATSIEDRQAVTARLRTFMHLPVAQRGAVILKDVLGYSLEEIGHVMQTTLPSVKAALHRGRTSLRKLADAPDERSIPAWRSRNARASLPMSIVSMPMISTQCERCSRTMSGLKSSISCNCRVAAR